MYSVRSVFSKRKLKRKRALRAFVVAAVAASAVMLIPMQHQPSSGDVCIGSECDTVAFVDGQSRLALYQDLVPSSNVGRFYYGDARDELLMGDWNCNGEQTPGMYRRSTGSVYLRNSNTQGVADRTFVFGNPGDIPIAGDFDGDGCDSLSIYRPSDAKFYITNSLGNGVAERVFAFGAYGDLPIVGDFDGDGRDTVGIHRPTSSYVALRNSLGGGAPDIWFSFGNPGDQIIAGDWNGDGDDTVGAYRASNGTIYLASANRTGVASAALEVGRYERAVTASGIDEVYSAPTISSPAAVAVPGIDAPPSRPSSGPIYISDESNVVIENVHISNPDGVCVSVSNSTNVTIRNSTIGPCGDHGVYLTDSDNITVSGNYVYESELGVLAHRSESIRVNGNAFAHTGRNFVQFDKVNGANSSVSGNRGMNEAGGSNAEDLISIWMSNGTASSPIRVADNHLRGGGPSDSGSGILLGDGGGSHQVAQGNKLVNPGQVGIGVAGGEDIKVLNNAIYATSYPWSNVGIYTWNFGDGCGSIEIAGNQIDWEAAGGYSNGYWDGGGCDVNMYGNDWDANLGAGIW